jgi:Ca2+-binding EF-hand superfamily protein
MQQSTSVTITKVVEKRTNQPTKVTTTAVSSSKPGTQVVNSRSHTTTSVSPNKPGTTQVVRSQVVTTSVSSNKPGTTSTQVVNNRRTQQTTTTTSTSKSPGKPTTTTTQAVNKRNQNSTTLKTSVSPSRQVTSTAQVVDNRPHKTVPVKAPPKETNQLQVADRRSHQSTSKPTSNANSKSGSRGASKGPSKAPSQAPTKKVEARKVISYSSTDGGDRIKEAFELFDSNDGKIDAREVKDAMVNIGYDEKNPVVYQVVTELDTPRNNNAGGASFDDFCQTVNNRLPDKETDEDLRRIFDLFVDDPDSDTTSLESIKRVADELGENIEEGELNAMLNKASKAGSRLTFEDFVSIMKDNF